MKDTRRRGVKAWVLYWEIRPGGPLPIAYNNEVVAVLPATWGLSWDEIGLQYPLGRKEPHVIHMTSQRP
jgi:hypothetical protein